MEAYRSDRSRVAGVVVGGPLGSAPVRCGTARARIARLGDEDGQVVNRGISDRTPDNSRSTPSPGPVESGVFTGDPGATVSNRPCGKMWKTMWKTILRGTKGLGRFDAAYPHFHIPYYYYPSISRGSHLPVVMQSTGTPRTTRAAFVRVHVFSRPPGRKRYGRVAAPPGGADCRAPGVRGMREWRGDHG